jgi:hypothetical protein
MSLVAATRRQVLRTGQAATLRRLSGTGPSQTPTDVAVTAVVRGFQPHEIAAGSGLMQGDRRVIITDHEIAEAGWPGPPRKNDRLVLAGALTTVQAVETRYLGAEIDRHIMVARG